MVGVLDVAELVLLGASQKADRSGDSHVIAISSITIPCQDENAYATDARDGAAGSEEMVRIEAAFISFMACSNKVE